MKVIIERDRDRERKRGGVYLHRATSIQTKTFGAHELHYCRVNTTRFMQFKSKFCTDELEQKTRN